MRYISIDGDDVGRRITSYYLSNNHSGLTELSAALQASTKEISDKLKQYGFNVIFCAADGVAAWTDLEVDCKDIFDEIRTLAPKGLTFSAGVGSNLRESYMALTSAKCNGKNCLHDFAEIDSKITALDNV